jgi:hypothetical protein
VDNSAAGVRIFPSVGWVSYLQVDPQLLAGTGARLRDAVAVASEVAGGSGALAALADDGGNGDLTGAVHEFMAKWKHGLGCLVEDAETLAAMLADSGEVYLEVETSIARAASPGGTGGSP